MTKTEQQPAAHQVILRPLESSDAEAVSALSHELGYTCEVSEMQSRIEYLVRSAERVALAAMLEGVLVGWIDAAVEHHLQSPDMVVIGGLVVGEKFRGYGIGRRLCQAVEDWATARGVTAVRVRSQLKRVDAHDFYQRNDYRQVKTSAVFEKKLPK